MKCEELMTYLSDYIDQDLSEELRVEAQEHLATCENCHVVLDTTQKMIVLYRQAERQVIPAERRTALFERLQRAMDSTGEGFGAC
jgi:anti-sigma factor RsiW